MSEPPAQQDDLSHSPLRLTIASSLHPEMLGLFCDGMLARADRLAVIWVDPSTAAQGFLRRRVTDSSGRLSADEVPLRNDCLSCTVQSAYGESLRQAAATGQYDSAIVELHPGVETAAAIKSLVGELAGVATIDTAVSVLDDDWLFDLGGDEALSQRGLDIVEGDHRTVATLLAAELDVADVIVLAGRPRELTTGSAEEYSALRALAPRATQLFAYSLLDVPLSDVLGTGRFSEARLDDDTDHGLLDSGADTNGESDMVLVRWSSDRPLHSARLNGALGDLTDGVVRSRGRLWMADLPEMTVHWESAGDALSIGPGGYWSGPRLNRLAFLGYQLDRQRLAEVLDRCVLTDHELACGPEGVHIPAGLMRSKVPLRQGLWSALDTDRTPRECG